MTAELKASIQALEILASRKGRPTRHDARPLLIAIGACLETGDRAAAEEARARLRALPAQFLETWEAAVRDELSMASTEHVRSVDPRYLEDASYDFEYTIEARRRLGARLSAAEFLGLPPDENTLAAVRRADSILELHRSPEG